MALNLEYLNTMANKQKFTPSDIISAIREHSDGSLGKLAVYLGVTEQTIRNYAKRYKKVQKALEEAQTERRLRLFSLAEDGFELALLEREWKAIQFALSTLGKKFYSTRTEVTGADGQPVIPISEEAKMLLEELGIEIETASDAFERMIRVQVEMIRSQADD